MAVGAARVLVVDDEPDFRGTVRRGLERDGYEVMEAVDAADALRRLQTESYDLLIVDLYMAGMTGLDLLESLRAAGYRGLPVIVVTALGDWGSYARALGLGAKAFLTKPMRMADLSRHVALALAVPRDEGAAVT
jgi:DNA-binding response OmpR family regulator